MQKDIEIFRGSGAGLKESATQYLVSGKPCKSVEKVTFVEI